jgi:hypothetical protein
MRARMRRRMRMICRRRSFEEGGHLFGPRRYCRLVLRRVQRDADARQLLLAPPRQLVCFPQLVLPRFLIQHRRKQRDVMHRPERPRTRPPTQQLTHPPTHPPTHQPTHKALHTERRRQLTLCSCSSLSFSASCSIMRRMFSSFSRSILALSSASSESTSTDSADGPDESDIDGPPAPAPAPPIAVHPTEQSMTQGSPLLSVHCARQGAVEHKGE